MPRFILRRFVSAVFVALLAVAFAPTAFADDLIFEITDPEGDDHGNGHLVYPIREDFHDGDLDMVAFRAYAVADGTRFEVEFNRRIRKPTAGAIDTLGTDLKSLARHGFYTFNIDVYIDKDREPGSGGVYTIPGRQAEIAEDHAWDRAIVVTPRPPEVRSNLRRMWVRQLEEAYRDDVDGPEADEEPRRDREREMQVRSALSEKVDFPQQIRVVGRTISFVVDSLFLGGQASPDWSYVVFVTGCDLVPAADLAASAGTGLIGGVSENLMAVQISPGTWRDRFGGGREEAPNQPPIVDLFVPAGASQERILSDFTSRGESPQNVKLPGVVPSAVASGAAER